MKYIVLFGLIAIAVVNGDLYAGKFDNINIQEILENKRLLEAYMKCMLNKGKCTPEGKDLKSHIKEALSDRCGKCSQVQKEKMEVVLGHILNHEEAYWNELVAMYDPDNKYSKIYEHDLRTVKQKYA